MQAFCVSCAYVVPSIRCLNPLHGPPVSDPPLDACLGAPDRAAEPDSSAPDDRELHQDKDYRLSVVQVRCGTAVALTYCGIRYGAVLPSDLRSRGRSGVDLICAVVQLPGIEPLGG